VSILEVRSIIENTYNAVLPRKFASTDATVQLLAISGQEAGWSARVQTGGPAHGLWQFEKGGGVHGALNHPASRRYVLAACAIRGVDPAERAIYDALPTDDLLACALARLLLYTDPRPLPAPGDVAYALGYYKSNWRPGRPHDGDWPENYAAAMRAMA